MTRYATTYLRADESRGNCTVLGPVREVIVGERDRISTGIVHDSELRLVEVLVDGEEKPRFVEVSRLAKKPKETVRWCMPRRDVELGEVVRGAKKKRVGGKRSWT